MSAIAFDIQEDKIFAKLALELLVNAHGIFSGIVATIADENFGCHS
jgi:hypothetical protein